MLEHAYSIVAGRWSPHGGAKHHAKNQLTQGTSAKRCPTRRGFTDMKETRADVLILF
jgi:hypothetical protein